MRVRIDQDIQDHIVPRARKGNHTLESVVPVCKSCNSRKGKRSLIECLMKGSI